MAAPQGPAVIPEWLPALVIGMLLFVVAPALLIAGVLYVVVSIRQIKDAVAFLAWRDHGGPAPRQRGNVLQFRRRSG